MWDRLWSTETTSGLEGAVFEAKIVKVYPGKGKCLLDFTELLEEEGSLNALQEVVFLEDIMPKPPQLMRDECMPWVLGDAVEAYENDAWWKGVVQEPEDDDLLLAKGHFIVYFPGTRDRKVSAGDEMRTRQAYVDGRWLPHDCQEAKLARGKKREQQQEQQRQEQQQEQEQDQKRSHPAPVGNKDAQGRQQQRQQQQGTQVAVREGTQVSVLELAKKRRRVILEDDDDDKEEEEEVRGKGSEEPQAAPAPKKARLPLPTAAAAAGVPLLGKSKKPPPSPLQIPRTPSEWEEELEEGEIRDEGESQAFRGARGGARARAEVEAAAAARCGGKGVQAFNAVLRALNWKLGAECSPVLQRALSAVKRQLQVGVQIRQLVSSRGGSLGGEGYSTRGVVKICSNKVWWWFTRASSGE
eukprot:jgi/Mesen1/2200/ME000152S01299